MVYIYMNSSYNNNVSFGDVLKSIAFSLNPKKVVEVGILEGYSLKCFAECLRYFRGI